MSVVCENVEIPFENGTRIYGDLYSGYLHPKSPLVIFVHGFKGFKNWGGFPYLLQILAVNGFYTFGFNFTNNGVSNRQQEDFTRLDLFAKNTFSTELFELGAVIDYFFEKAELYNIDKERIALIGHSRGGGISIIKASSDMRIKCLVTLASVSYFDRYSSKLKTEWKRKGYIEVENTRTKQMMRLNATLLEDLENNKDKLDIISSAAKLKIPSMFIHGKEDLGVRYEESEEIYNSSNKKLSQLILIENTGHTFGITHPFAGTTQAFEKAIKEITEFLKNHL